jgi:hypothetical protein
MNGSLKTNPTLNTTPNTIQETHQSKRPPKVTKQGTSKERIKQIKGFAEIKRGHATMHRQVFHQIKSNLQSANTMSNSKLRRNIPANPSLQIRATYPSTHPKTPPRRQNRQRPHMLNRNATNAHPVSLALPDSTCEPHTSDGEPIQSPANDQQGERSNQTPVKGNAAAHNRSKSQDHQTHFWFEPESTNHDRKEHSTRPQATQARNQAAR